MRAAKKLENGCNMIAVISQFFKTFLPNVSYIGWATKILVVGRMWPVGHEFDILGVTQQNFWRKGIVWDDVIHSTNFICKILNTMGIWFQFLGKKTTWKIWFTKFWFNFKAFLLLTYSSIQTAIRPISMAQRYLLSNAPWDEVHLCITTHNKC